MIRQVLRYQNFPSLLAEVPIKRIGRADMADYAPLRDLDLDAFYVRH